MASAVQMMHPAERRLQMEGQNRLTFGPFQLDAGDERLWHGHEVVRLKPKAFAVLQCLLAHAGQLVTKDTLLATVWPETAGSDAVLAVAIRELRRALGDPARSPHFIETVHARGYRFIAAVAMLSQATATPSAAAPADHPPRFCPACQHANPREASFCNACATPLNDNPPQITTAEPLISAAPSPQDPVPVGAATPLPEAELRQLTVMFCDLVASTPLAETLDPEELREVMYDYYATCTAVIDPLDGHIAQYLGDGLLTYFGYPQAHEDDAQRAVRAGLGILLAMEPLNTRLERAYGVRLAIRIGIHTGPVVVGSMGHGERQAQLALGTTLNITARLQGLAASNTLAISDATYQLVRGYFIVDDLGLQILPGVSAPLQVFRVMHESTAQSRLEAAAGHNLTAFVGRDAEIALLQDRWTSVKTGRGQVVVISGEAGIGKSRLLQVLKDDIMRGDYLPLECRTSPYHQHSVLYPVIDLLKRRLEWDRHESPARQLERLEDMLSPCRLPLSETVPLFAALLSLPLPDDRYPPLHLSAEQQRHKLFEAMVLSLIAEAERQPVLFILEDLHWADPSTLVLLDLLIEQVPVTSMLLLFTSRPEFALPWGFRSHLTPMALHRLSRAHTALMVARVSGGKALPTGLIEQLVDRTDGVPLFVEEMTKAVLESAILQDTNPQDTSAGPATAVTIPASLQDSLMARLDHLVTAKHLAQLGAAIGRQFAYGLLQAVTQLDDVTLQRELRQLVEAELVFQSGLPPHATYLFKHALIQDVAYQSLLKSRRQHYHERIVQVLLARFPETVATQPELLAHHCTEAGLTEQAIPYWQRAGELASERSAYAEALAHLGKGLEVVHTLADTRARNPYELQLQLALGNTLTATKGYAAPQVEQAYTRVLALCERLPDSPQRFDATMGLWRFYYASADFQMDRRVAEQLLHLAQRQHNPLYLMQAHLALGDSLFRLGELASGIAYLEHGLDFTPHQPSDDIIGTRIACLAMLSWLLWQRGYMTQALHRIQEALTLAQALHHPFTCAFAQAQAIILHQLRRDTHATQAGAEAVITLCAKHGFSFWSVYGTMMQGWIFAMQGRTETGIAQMHQSLQALQRQGSAAEMPYFFTLLAEAYGQEGQVETGLQTLAQAFATMAKTQERCWEAELHRLKGVLLLQLSPDRHAEAATCLHRALVVARQQQAKSYELRAAMSLCRLWQQQGKTGAARALLTDVYEWFTEGFDTADLQEARALLDIL